jgi:hypothetical protein
MKNTQLPRLGEIGFLLEGGKFRVAGGSFIQSTACLSPSTFDHAHPWAFLISFQKSATQRLLKINEDT